MNFAESIRHVLSNYANFNGRARRSEFWWFALFYLAVQIVSAAVDTALFTGEFAVLGTVATLALIVPYLAVAARRLHDTDRSGWWLLLSFVPLIGAIVLIVFFVQRGTDGSNRFGEAPMPTLSIQA